MAARALRLAAAGRLLALLAAAAMLSFAAAALVAPHLLGGSPRPAQQLGVPVGGYLIAAPSYTAASWDATRIASFSFRLGRATPGTTVRAGVARSTFADSCRIGRIDGGTATVTCSYGPGDEPRIRDATRLTVVASD